MMEWIIAVAALMMGMGMTHLIYRRMIRRKIEDLIAEIHQLTEKNYRINMKQDMFSPLEDEIYKLFLQTVEEKEQINKLYETQSKNLEDIAHQIKTPITALSFQVENLSFRDAASAEGLQAQLTRLNELTDVLLKLAHLEAHLFQMKEETFSLREVTDYALDILDGELVQNKVEICTQELDYIITGDYYWIGEAMINLLKNALALSNGRRIWIFGKENPLYIQLSIRDEGGGIAEEDLPKIFRRFYKRPDSEGFGLGLAMAKSIVNANHGEIVAENVGDGAQFSLKFYKVT